MDAERILAFRLARSGLAGREADGLAAAAACPASDFARDAALLALAARAPGVTREAYDAATDAGGLVVAHVVRGAIHALAPRDHALYGRALIATDDDELGAQLGRQVQRLTADSGVSPAEALAEVAEATEDALRGGRALDRSELHEEYRARVRGELMPWCRGCGSHHVAPMLWRYATVRAGVRLDSRRRYVLGAPGRAPAAHRALTRFLRFYGPATVADFAAWAGVPRPLAERLWAAVEDDLSEVRAGTREAWLLRDDAEELDSPTPATGVRLLPPGDPYLQTPNRPLLAPEPELRRRLFRPVASPGAVLAGGRLAGLWRARAKGGRAEIEVEALGSIPRADLEEEAKLVARLRGASEAVLVVR